MSLGPLCSGLLALVFTAGMLACRRQPPPAPPSSPVSPPSPTVWAGTLSPSEVGAYFHLPIGSDWLPQFALAVLKQDDGRPFMDDLERFGLLPDPSPEHNDEGLPVGMTMRIPLDLPHFNVRFYGFTCAACHVGEQQVGGATVRIVGAPGRFDVGRFFGEVGRGLDALLADVSSLEPVMLWYYDEVTRASEDMSDPTGLKRVLIGHTLGGKPPVGQEAFGASLRQDLDGLRRAVRSLPEAEVVKRDPLLGQSEPSWQRQRTGRRTRALLSRLTATTPAAPFAPAASLTEIPTKDRLPLVEELLADFDRVLHVLRRRLDQARSVAARIHREPSIRPIWNVTTDAKDNVKHGIEMASLLGARISPRGAPLVAEDAIRKLMRLSHKLSPSPAAP